MIDGECGKETAEKRQRKQGATSLLPLQETYDSWAFVVMKNELEFVLGPLLDMETTPGRSCLTLKFSSGKTGPEGRTKRDRIVGGTPR